MLAAKFFQGAHAGFIFFTSRSFFPDAWVPSLLLFKAPVQVCNSIANSLPMQPASHSHMAIPFDLNELQLEDEDSQPLEDAGELDENDNGMCRLSFQRRK